ncbi:hypothetical protein ACH4LN_10830 [Streptomyces albus]|uniref:hypothetical protein n=1 Tax=Streptomyces TaxID=1883 RepID=UPI00034E19AF|nr:MULTISPECIES: hypothetical protein [Streptomyces]EPD96415.1 hypothetical protein HMPREF1486_01014 [Streptomyces sp. HPH0547]UVN57762.1 hypothetical protein NR995_26960 [Streptomyces albus]GHJ20270.1 hypothetical protein TPA0909_18840 [Streptomyces albus]
MKPARTLQWSALTVAAAAAVLGASSPAVTASPQAQPRPPQQAVDGSSLPATAASAQAAPVPPACQEMIFKTKEKFPTTRYTVPDEPWNALLGAMGNLTPAEQAELTETACAAWNRWAAANGPTVATDLDNRYRNAAPPACNKFTVSTLGAIKKYAPGVPAATRRLEKVVKKVWTEAMTKLSTSAPDAACRTAYSAAKTGW